MVKVTVDWIEVKYALVRFTVRCIKLALIITMVAWSVLKVLIGSLVKGKDNE